RVLVPKGCEAASPVRVGDKNVMPSILKGTQVMDIMLPEETRRGDSVLVRFRYWLKTNAKPVEGMGSVELGAPTFPVDSTSGEGHDAGATSDATAKTSGSVPVARFTRNVYLPSNACYVDFDTDMTTHFERGGLFEGLKNVVFGHLRETEGAWQ